MPEINPLTNNQIFLKKIAENTGSDYDIGDVSEINPLTIEQILLKEIAANTAGQSGDITELEGKVADNTSAIEAIVNEYGAKNLLPPYLPNSTSGGVTLTLNVDGTISCPAVTVGGTYFITGKITPTYSGTYIFSGCPSGGGDSTYYHYLQDATSGTVMDVDTGQEVEVELLAGHTYESHIYIKDVSSAITFYPMIRDARITDPTYVPYAMTNRELTEICSDIPSELFKGFTGSSTRITDFNLLPNGVQAVLTDTNTAHRPNENDGWVVFTCTGLSTYWFGLQLAISYDNNVFMRRYWNDWGSWIQLN